MAARMIMLFSLLTLCIGSVACERLKQERAVVGAVVGELKIETLQSLDAIPADYGNLVGVTSSSSRPNWAQLWFEKPDKTIVVVYVDFVEGGLHSKYIVIPRR